MSHISDVQKPHMASGGELDGIDLEGFWTE